MDQQQNCRGCAHRNTCGDVYHRLGQSHTPSVLRPVLLAFVIPLILGVTCLGVFQFLLQGHSPRWVALAGASGSLLVTLTYAGIVRGIGRRSDRQ